jgi:hypothetical protein
MAVTLKATDGRSLFTCESAQTPTEAFAEAVRQRVDLSDLDPSKYEVTGAPRKQSSGIQTFEFSGADLRAAFPDRN